VTNRFDVSGLATADDIHALPTTPGSYLLLFYLPTAVDGVQIGKLGVFSLTPGSWIYCGSAWGSGGLRSRVRRHLQAHKKLHWHIDFLTHRLPILSVLMVPQSDRSVRLECVWTQHLLSLPGFSTPIPHFGSSDCRDCPAHLVHTPRLVTVEEMRRLIG
jgi:Uri superfamily endonuclease